MIGIMTNVSQSMSEVQKAAMLCVSLGFSVCRVPSGKKNPKDKGWPTCSAKPEDFGSKHGIGLVCGWPSNGGKDGCFLVCVDLDNEDAIRLAPSHLPPTGAKEGRNGKPSSHWWYLVQNVPPWATSKAPQAAAAAIAKGLHPGPFKKQFKHDETKKTVIDFQGSGHQAVVPPSFHEKSGEYRRWEPGCSLDQIASVEFEVLWEAVCALAKASGATVPDIPKESKVTKTKAEKSKKAEKGKKAAGASKPDSESEPKAGLVLGTGIPLSVSMDERVKRCERYLARVELAKSGHAGHSTTYRIARLIVNDFAVNDTKKALELMRVYNSRLELHGEETWSEADMVHKIDSAMAAGHDAEHRFGCKLHERADTPRSWSDPARLAEGFLKGSLVRFLKQTAFEYWKGTYQIVGSEWLTSQVRRYIEGEAAKEYERLQRAWEGKRDTLEDQLKTTPPDDTAGKKAREKASKDLEKLIAKPVVAEMVFTEMVSNTLGAMRARAQLEDSTELDSWLGGRSGPSVLAVENGLLDPIARTLSPHSEDWFSTAKLPVAYDPNAGKPVKWLATLSELMEGDADLIAIIQEIFGACLDRRLSLKFFAAMVGSGDNGKSVVLCVLSTMLGKGNCSSVNLDELTTNRFAAFNLFGKLANVVGDQGHFESADEGRLKTLTGGDLVTFEQKGKDSFAAVNHAKLVFAANAMPTFADKSEAVWNRLIAVPFSFTVPAGKKNPALLTPDYWATEMPGILIWALEGLARLRSAGRFTRSEKCEALKGQTRLDSNPARLFVTQEFEWTGTESDRVTVDETYQAFKLWCEKNGFKHPLTKPKFGRELRAAYPELGESKVVRTGDSTTRFWIGLKASTGVSQCDELEKAA